MKPRPKIPTPETRNPKPEIPNQVNCRAAAGGSSTLRVAVTAGAGVGSLTEALSYDASVNNLYGSNNLRGNVPHSGSVSVSVFGAGFGGGGASVAARGGASACEASAWYSSPPHTR